MAPPPWLRNSPNIAIQHDAIIIENYIFIQLYKLSHIHLTVSTLRENYYFWVNYFIIELLGGFCRARSSGTSDVSARSRGRFSADLWVSHGGGGVGCRFSDLQTARGWVWLTSHQFRHRYDFMLSSDPGLCDYLTQSLSVCVCVQTSVRPLAANRKHLTIHRDISIFNTAQTITSIML